MQEIEPAQHFTRDDIEAAFRTGYGMGADGVQNERRRRAFLLEDDAWASYWLPRLRFGPSPTIAKKVMQAIGLAA